MKDLIKKILKEDRELDRFAGWVNVKIDSELNKRIERLMTGLGFHRGNLAAKIRFLSDPVHGRIRQGETVGQALNRKITAMILLEYLKEIKTLFDSSSAGFLFEDFIAGLLGGETVPGKGAVDVRVGSERYQIKLYGQSSKNIARPTPRGEQPTKFILGIKVGDDIEIYEMVYETFLLNMEELRDRDDNIRGLGMSVDNFTNLANNLGTLRLSNISAMSDALNIDLSASVSSLWNTMSELQFNVETMLTGINKKGEKTTTLVAANAAQNNARELDEKITEVRGFFKPRTLA